MTENTLTANAFGILLVNTGEPGPAFDWTLVQNHADENTAFCPGDEGPPTCAGPSRVQARGGSVGEEGLGHHRERITVRSRALTWVFRGTAFAAGRLGR